MQKPIAVTIDSSPTTRHLVRMALEFAGFSVREANRCETALELLQSVAPDLAPKSGVKQGTPVAASAKVARIASPGKKRHVVATAAADHDWTDF